MDARGDGEQRRALRRAFEHAGIGFEAAWLRYFSLGGRADAVDVDAHLAGDTDLPPIECDTLAQAVNELLDEQGWRPRVPYSHELRGPRPEDGPLAALLAALAATHMSPPERFAEVVLRAGRALRAHICVYLVDYEQERLHPVPGRYAGAREPLGVDTSLAGKAFREIETFTARGTSGTVLWVPLVDGVERLGVLEVALDETADALDTTYRHYLTWTAVLLGHLCAATTRYGDLLDGARRQHPRNAAAELITHLLPPATAATDRVVVAGMVQPCYTVGGDAFDYALSETTAHLAIFDATGHSLESGAATAKALSAYRSARRAGDPLYAQAAAVDEVLAGSLQGANLLVTAVLAELEVLTGRLRYINAGHPYPLVVRGGKVVKALPGGRRPVFGLAAAGGLTVGEELLEPGDWFVLYTDGISEARDGDGRLFGVPRLEDFLERETSAGHPVPEMVRRLIRGVLIHQQGVLQDDASVLVARWGDFTRELGL